MRWESMFWSSGNFNMDQMGKALNASPLSIRMMSGTMKNPWLENLWDLLYDQSPIGGYTDKKSNRYMRIFKHNGVLVVVQHFLGNPAIKFFVVKSDIPNFMRGFKSLHQRLASVLDKILSHV